MAFGFSSKEAVHRTIRGVRDVERLRSSTEDAVPFLPTPGGATKVIVRVTSTTSADGYYPGTLLYWNIEYNGSGDDQKWMPFTSDVDSKCYIRGLNDDEPEENKQYEGYVAGLFQLFDGEGMPGPQVYNGYPLVMASIPKKEDPKTACEDYDFRCEDGWLRKYKCDANSQYTEFVEEVGPCEESEIPQPPPVPPVPPVPPTTPPPKVVPVDFNAVNEICVRRGRLVKVSADYAMVWYDTVIHVLTGTAGHTITLPDPADDPLGVNGAGTTSVTVKRIGPNAPAITSASGQIDGTSFVTIGTDQGHETFHHDGEHWFSGVAWPVVDVTQKQMHVHVRAPGFVTDPECVIAPNCCSDGLGQPIGPGGDCCPLGALATLGFTAKAGVALAGGETFFEGTLTVANGGGSWSTADPVFGTGAVPGATSASIELVVYCVPGGFWEVEGKVYTAEGDTISFMVQLEDDGIDLSKVIDLPGYGKLILVIDHPCPVGFLTDCVDGIAAGCNCAGNMDTNWKVYLLGADPDVDLPLAVVTLQNDGLCRFHQAVTEHWRMWQGADDVWYLEDVANEVTRFCNDFNCCTGGTFLADPLSGLPSLRVVPTQDCCPPPPSFNCSSGSCVDPGDGTGMYATAEECLAACTTSFPACNLVPDSLTMTVTSSVSCLNGFTNNLTQSLSIPGYWEDGNDPSPCGTDLGATFICSGGGWTGMYNGVTLNYVSETSTSVTFTNATGDYPFAAPGDTTFVISIP